jgi:hypothetical protein
MNENLIAWLQNRLGKCLIIDNWNRAQLEELLENLKQNKI